MDAFGYQLPGLDDIEYLEQVGDGRLSEIYKARRRHDGDIVALKYLPVGDGEPLSVQREIEALELLNGCSRILRYHGVYRNDFGISLVLDFFPMDLSTYMQEYPGDCNTRIDMIIDMLEAVNECHTRGIIHRDISPYNFLVDTANTVTLADFGISIRATQSTNRTPGMGTLWYMAPEILFGSREYTTASDVWSLGCVIAELILARPLWKGTSQLDQICRIIDDLGTPREDSWPELPELPDWGKLRFPPKEAKPWNEVLPDVSNGIRELVQGMLVYNPSKRLSLDECITKITKIVY